MTKLLILLQETGESFAAFGRRLKHPKPTMTVSRWANGKQTPSGEDAEDIIEAIDADPRTEGRLSWEDIYRPQRVPASGDGSQTERAA